MIETLGTTLVVVFAVLIFLAQVAGIASFIMNLVQGSRLRRLVVEMATEKLAREKEAAAAKAELDKTRAEMDKERAAAAAKVETDRAAAAAKAELDQGRAEIEREKAAMVAKAERTEVIDGQFKLADLLTAGLKAQIEYLNKVAKEVIDSNFDVVIRNTEDVLKLNTENSQKVYDAMMILIQMMNNLMTAMGYRPAAPDFDSSLQEPKRGQNYSKPPAPEAKDDLVFSKP